MLPKTLARLPYFLRWLCLLSAVGLIAALLLPLEGRVASKSAVELSLVLLLGVWMILKIGMLDMARARNIGWSPWMALLCLVPLVSGIMQILLFVMPPKQNGDTLSQRSPAN
jgi:uncharacterized membrane protein YhaH (DUF805 family)